MAMKYFDDNDKKARELEAQAKKLRREKRVAQAQAYADALVKYFPGVKDCNSVDEVDAYVARISKVYERYLAQRSAQNAVVREPVKHAESSDGNTGSQGAQGSYPEHRPFD